MNFRSLSPELARHNPEAFLEETASHLATTTELGALAWNTAIENGTLDLSKAEVKPDQWQSFSSQSGRLILGAAPMNEDLRNAIIFEGESLTYKDEVARRLLHELGHRASFSAQDDPAMKELNVLAYDIRRHTPELGLSALGSINYYSNPEAKKLEDIAELLTMRMTAASHSDMYLQLLKSPRYQNARDAHGIVTLADTSYLKGVIESAVVEGLMSRR